MARLSLLRGVSITERYPAGVTKLLKKFTGLAALPLLLALPGFAQQNTYGGYDIVSFPPSEAFYAAARGWNVFHASGPSGFAYCFAESVRSDGAALRLGWDGLQWQLAVPVTSYPEWQGTLQIDGMGSGRGYGSGGDDASGTAVGGWTIVWLGLAELDGLQKGQGAVVGIGRGDFDFSLSGSTAAILKVEECVSRQGFAPASAPAAPLQPEPTESYTMPYSMIGNWVVNEIRAGQQLLACETIDPSNPNLRFEVDALNSYIDFRDGGAMANPGMRMSVNVGFGPGSMPTRAEAEIIEGRDGNAWGRITENRMSGPGMIDDSFPNAQQVSFSGPGVFMDRDLYGTNAALAAVFQCSGNIR